MTKKAKIRVKPPRYSGGQAGHGQCLYVSLPSEAVTREMLDGPLAVDALQMSIVFPYGKQHHVITAHRDSRINLYALNKPLEEIQAEYVSQQNEILVLRNRLMLMAVNIDLGDEVPSVKNHATWPLLASKILRAIGHGRPGRATEGPRRFSIGHRLQEFLPGCKAETILMIMLDKWDVLEANQHLDQDVVQECKELAFAMCASIFNRLGLDVQTDDTTLIASGRGLRYVFQTRDRGVPMKIFREVALSCAWIEERSQVQEEGCPCLSSPGAFFSAVPSSNCWVIIPS